MGAKKPDPVRQKCTGGCFDRSCTCGGQMIKESQGVLPAALIALTVAVVEDANRKGRR